MHRKICGRGERATKGSALASPILLHSVSAGDQWSPLRAVFARHPPSSVVLNVVKDLKHTVSLYSVLGFEILRRIRSSE